MKAKEARLKSTNAKSYTKHYKAVIQRVEEESKKGEFFAWIYEPIPELTKQVLVTDGYEFSEESNHRNDYLIKISW